MYICSAEEVVTDKGCGQRLHPWLVFLLDSFLPAHSYQTPLVSPSSKPAVSHECLFCCPAPLPHTCMRSTGSLQRLGAHGLPSPVMATTGSALACCLHKRWTPCLDPALSRANL